MVMNNYVNTNLEFSSFAIISRIVGTSRQNFRHLQSNTSAHRIDFIVFLTHTHTHTQVQTSKHL